MFSKHPIKVGMGQMLVTGGQLNSNLERAVIAIRQAKARHCDLIVLPECLDGGWTYPDVAKIAQPIPGNTSDILCQAASDQGIYVVAGITESAGKRYYNTAILISPQGEILLKHRKINLLKIEQPYYSTGDSLQVADTPLGRIGVNICADNTPDSLVFGHSLARMGAEMILSPCAWAVSPDWGNKPYGRMWEKAYTTLAKLYNIPVVGVSNVGWVEGGPWDGHQCIGNSLAVDSEGEIAAKASFGLAAEELLAVDLTIVKRSITGTSWSEFLQEKSKATSNDEKD